MMDQVLYKYRSDTAFTETLITSGKVFLATAHQLNDPFECTLQEISHTWMEEQAARAMQAALAGFAHAFSQNSEPGGRFFGLRQAKASAAVKEIFAAGDLERSYVAMRAFIKKRTGKPPSDCRTTLRKLDAQLTETGIFSLSADPAQPLMWAHYGGEHRGLSFGFRPVAGSRLADPDHCLPVTYSDDLPAMQGDGLTVTVSLPVGPFGAPSQRVAFNDKTFQAVVTTKATDWAYEQEYRYIEPFGGLCVWPGELAECTFGLRCPDDRRKHYIDLLEAHVLNPVLLFEMRAKPGTSRLERVPLDRPATEPRPAAKTLAADAETVTEMSSQDFVARLQQLLQQRNYEEVIFQVDENLEDHPDDPLMLDMKATAYGLAQDHEVAYSIYKRLSELYPEAPAGWYGMCCALEAMGQLDRCVELLERAYQLDPNDSSFSLNLGAHLLNDPERRAEGLDYLRKAHRLGHRRAQRMINDAEREYLNGA